MGGNSGRNGGGEGPANRYQTPPPPKKKNPIVEFVKGGGVLGAIGRGLEEAARPYNTRKRKEFISKYNTSVPPGERIDMTDEKIGSKEGLAKLREVGYKTNQDIIRESQSRGNGVNINQTTQVPKTILSPTTAEVSQSEAANATSDLP